MKSSYEYDWVTQPGDYNWIIPIGKNKKSYNAILHRSNK